MDGSAASSVANSISKRAEKNLVFAQHWKPIQAVLENAWHKDTNPNGIINLGIADNTLMHSEMSNFTKDNFSIDPSKQLAYGTDPQGSMRLRKALASIFNTHFHAREEVTADQILISAGVAAIADTLSWALCDEGEAIFVPQPLYTAFAFDFNTRSRAQSLPVSFEGLPGYRTVDDIFDADLNSAALERAWENAQAQGIRPRAFVLTNPHNPLGKCYPPATIRAIATFCGQRGLHLISDEIYALSEYTESTQPAAPTFVSALALNLDDCIDPRNVHVLYGASKDFGASGLRLGVLHSRLPQLLDAMSTVARFAWPAYLVQDIWACILEDRSFLDAFIADNRNRLLAAYHQLTSFLDQHGIGYLHNTTAGIFLWVDLRPYLVDDSVIVTSKDIVNELRVAGPNATHYTQREDALAKACLARGVNIGKSASFRAEELGWFRVTFTVGEERLRVGLERLTAALADVRGTVP